MNEQFENELRRRLRAVDAPEGFAERLMAALPAERKPTVVCALSPSPRVLPASSVCRPRSPHRCWLRFSSGMHVANDRALVEEQKGIAASQQLMQALRVTSQKLDLAYEAVNNPPTAGDEENRS